MPDHNNYMKSVVIGGCNTVLMGQTCFGLRIKWQKRNAKETSQKNLNERILGRPRNRRLNNIKTYLTKIEWERIDWINLRVEAADGLM